MSDKKFAWERARVGKKLRDAEAEDRRRDSKRGVAASRRKRSLALSGHDQFYEGPWDTLAAYLASETWRGKRLQAFAAYGTCCQTCGESSGVFVVRRDPSIPYGQETVADLCVMCRECYQKQRRQS